MTTRRELLLQISMIPLAAEQSTASEICESKLQNLIEQIKDRIGIELPAVVTVKISYDPSDEKIPLMILAMNV